MAIIFRAVREQLEHDRIIRLLQEKFRRHFDVEVNVGDERSATFKMGTATYFPDLILTSRQPPRRVVAVFEIETAESVNHLEAMAQWANFSKGKAAFHLYVPDAKLDIARHLCGEHQVKIGQLWSFLPLGDGDEFRFTKVEDHEALPIPPEPKVAAGKAKATAPPSGPAAVTSPKAAKQVKPAKPAKPPTRPAARPAKTAKPKPAARPKAAVSRAAKPAPKKAVPVRRVAKPTRPAAKKAPARATAKKPVKKAAPKKALKKR